jgi:hypothetical protein
MSRGQEKSPAIAKRVFKAFVKAKEVAERDTAGTEYTSRFAFEVSGWGDCVPKLAPAAKDERLPVWGHSSVAVGMRL